MPAAAAPEGENEDLAAPLLAWADSDTDEGKAPLTIEFKADVEGGKPPLSYVWKFGDGTPDSTEANPKHTYQKAGKYRADLQVKDSGGDEDSDYLEIEVTE
jgi:PKD repeat protein